MGTRDETREDVAGRSPGTGGVDMAALAGRVVGLLGGGAGNAPGGLASLGAAFEHAGLGAEFRSWVGPGDNLPITGAGLERALGSELLGRLAGPLGADPARVAAGLAALLPRVIDRLTPAGVIPEADSPAAAERRP